MRSYTRWHGKQQSLIQISNVTSLALVRSFLNAAVGTIAHTRELIPWNSSCFQTRQVNELNIGAEHIDGVLRGVGIEEALQFGLPGSKSQEFRILCRGENERADAILDMLDGGVADALDKSYLKSFQLLVVANAADPASTLESYTFTFAYTNGAVSQIDISSEGFTSFTIENLHRGFGKSIKGLLKSMADLPRLPRHRSLGFALLYNDRCPQDYHPAGFLDPNKHNQLPLRGCWTDLWQDIPSTIANMSAGCHEIAVGARNLQYQGAMRCTRLQDIFISKQIQELQKTSSRDPDITSTVAGLQSTSDTTLVNVHHDTPIEVDVPTTNTGSEIDQAQVGPNPQRSRLRAPAGVTAPVNTTNKLSKLTVAAKSRRRRNVCASKIAELLVQARAMENAHRGPEKLFDQKQLLEGRIRILDRSGLVQCECGGRHETVSMLCCELCGTKQHRACYGWDELRSGSLPFDHFCYNCLLLPMEDKKCFSMVGVVQMRRAICFLAKEQSTEINIGDDFRCRIFQNIVGSEAAFAKLIETLEKEGIIRRNNGNTAQILEIANERIAEIRETYLDPLASVTQHYSIVRDGDTSEKRKEEVNQKLRLYIGERSFSHDDHTNSRYDRVHVQNNIGQEVIRWGFYANWKKRKISSDQTPHIWQKTGVSDKFVNVDSVAPNETLSIDDIMHEAVNEAQWTMRLNRRFASENSDG